MIYETIIGDHFLYQRETNTTNYYYYYPWGYLQERVYYLAKNTVPILTYTRDTPQHVYPYYGISEYWTFASLISNSSGNFLYKEGF